MQVIAVVESDECGPAAIVDPEHITIMKFDDLYLAATRCMYTHTPISCEISEETAQNLIQKGVKCLSLSSDRPIAGNEKEQPLNEKD